jgi:hypothetical protein
VYVGRNGRTARSRLIVFPDLDMSIALNGRVSVHEGNIVLTGCGGCGLYLMP